MTWAEWLAGVLDDLHQLRTEIVNKAVVVLEVPIFSNEAHIAQLTAQRTSTPGRLPSCAGALVPLYRGDTT